MLSQPSLICGEKLQVNHYHINSGITLLNVRRTGTCLYRMSDFSFAIDRHLRRDWHLTKCKHRFWLELKPLKNSNFRVLPFLLLYCIFPRARGQEPVTAICDISLAAVEWGFANVLFPSWFWDPSFCWLRSQVSSIKCDSQNLPRDFELSVLSKPFWALFDRRNILLLSLKVCNVCSFCLTVAFKVSLCSRMLRHSCMVQKNIYCQMSFTLFGF